MSDLESGAASLSASDAGLSAAPFNQAIHALVVTHDGARWLPELISSLSDLTYSPQSIRAIDTGSLDRSIGLLQEASIPLRSTDRNSGFGEAVNLGVDWITEEIDTDPSKTWIWLLHDDCAPLPDALEKLVFALADAPSVAMAGPKIRGWHDRNHLLEVGVSIAGNGARWTGLERRERDQGQHDGVRDVLAVSSAGALIRLDVWQELSGFDPHLTLFRDDVDFGWRVNVAGHRVIAVPDAVVLHAEAAATERREIDVEGATLHRPHLLDRRNANYVLLANSSRWRLPQVLARLVVSTVVRTIGYLFAKLPGYAGDEIAALALILARPDLIRTARRVRAQSRLLPASAVSSYLAPDGSQIRLAFESLRELVFKGIAPMSNPSSSFSDARYAVAEDDEAIVKSNSFLLRALKIPAVSLFLILALINLVAFRGKWGNLSGGALLPAPASGADLISTYFDSWHPIGIGTSTPAPPWMLILGFFSIITFGNLQVLVSLIFFLAMPITGIAMHRALGKHVHDRGIRIAGSVIYSFSPVLLIAMSDGELTLILAAMLLPWALSIWWSGASSVLQRESFSQAKLWRSIFVAIIMIALLPQLVFSFLLGVGALTFKARTQGRKRVGILVALFVLTPILALLPWSVSAILHPTLWLRSFGLGPESGNAWNLTLFNPGGFYSPPFWMGAPLLLGVLLVVIRSGRARIRIFANLSITVLTISILLSALTVTPYGSPVPSRVWSGPGVLLATALAIYALALVSDGLSDRLRNLPLSKQHVESLVTTVALLISIVTGIGWQILTPSPLNANSEQILPAFVAASLQSTDRSRVLVLRATSSGTKYSVVREGTSVLGDPEVSGLMPDLLETTLAELMTGGSNTTSRVLGQFAIKYVFVASPAPAALSRVLDGVGGLRRVSATDQGALWKITNPSGRLVFLSDKAESPIVLPSSRVSAQVAIPGPGKLSLSEKLDPKWSVLLDEEILKPVKSGSWNPTYRISQAGELRLIHDSSFRRLALGLQFLTLIALLIMCLPGGRRWVDRPDEEVS
ncbi:MAG: hypothetical protein CK545_02635 [Actinobacteria bacterium]|nr:MAG: hypothetical protein CK545_02635 [Actinomycetota bacterium]